MSFLDSLFGRKNPNIVMQPLYEAIVATGRQPEFYETGAVPDTLDGRFDMICAILCLVIIRMEKEGTAKKEIVWLTEIFVDDMDGQLRQLGIGDMIVGKHIGKMMSALGGRMGAYREALRGEASLEQALIRNLYRGEAPDNKAAEFVAARLQQFDASLAQLPISDIIAGHITETEK